MVTLSCQRPRAVRMRIGILIPCSRIWLITSSPDMRARVASAAAAPASVLLLGFFGEGTAEKASREALVAATDLAGLEPSQIEEAFQGSRPVRASTDRKDLFPESSSKRRRGGS